MVADLDRNLAVTEPADTIAPALTEHSRKMDQRIYRSAGNVFSAVGFGLPNMILIEGDDARFDRSRGLAVFAKLPIVHLLENVVCRVDPEKTSDVRMALGLRFTDTKRDYALEIRRGVVELHDSLPERRDVTLTTTESVFRGVLLRQSSFVKECALRRIQVDGKLADVSGFFEYFDQPLETLPKIVLR